MSAFDTLKDKIMRTPTAKDIQPEELKNFLKKYGFELKSIKGDHYVYKYPKNNIRHGMLLSIPMHRPVKPTYIDLVRRYIIEIEEDKDE